MTMILNEQQVMLGALEMTLSFGKVRYDIPPSVSPFFCMRDLQFKGI